MKNVPQEEVQAIADVKVSILQIRKKITRLNNKMRKHNNSHNQKVYVVGEQGGKKKNNR